MHTLSEWESKRRLGGQLPRPLEILARSRDEARDFAASLERPVVAKTSGVSHKTESRLVRLGLGPAQVSEVWDELAAAGDGTVLVAEQLTAELELIVGGYRDPGFGALVTVGIGGIAAEIFRDIVAILAPPEEGELARAVKRLAGHRLLEGLRGAPPTDLQALSRIVQAVAGLLTADDGIAEIDCNPVMVCNGNPVVADALIVLSGSRDP